MLDSKEISAVELTEQYLDRIENSDKEINSYITVCKENALADAKKAQEVIDSGNSGAFTGLPILIAVAIVSGCKQGSPVTRGDAPAA